MNCQNKKNKIHSLYTMSKIYLIQPLLGPRPLGPKEIDGLLVSPGKASSLLTDHLITGYPLRSERAQEKWFQVKPSTPISLSTPISPFGLVGWIFQALVGCHDILIFGKSPIKWRQRPDMTSAVDWDVKH